MQLVPFSPKQLQAMNWWSQPKYRRYDAMICDGAVRSGKTLAMSIGFVVWAMTTKKDTNFAICGKTITSVRRNLVTPLLQMLRSLGFQCMERVSKNYVDITFSSVSNRFYLFGGKDESSAALIQGMTLGGVLLDEVVLMPRSFVEQALARCSEPESKFWFNCNPENPSHWFYREWIQKAREKNACYLHFTMADNPSLSPNVRKRYERMYNGAFYDRYILGKWSVTEGRIYPMFSEARHCFAPSEMPLCDKWYISCDYGTVNPSSFGLWGHADGVWYRLREYYYDARQVGERRTDEEHYQALEQLAADLPVTAVIVDPSAASFLACIQRHGKFRAIAAKNEVLEGIQQVSQMLLADKLRFSRSCRDICREFEQYCWSDSIKGDIPKKENDHAMDDMRYFVRTVLRESDDTACFFVAATER